MRKTILVLNLIVIVFFVCFLVYTVVARQHFDTLARDFVTEKTLGYSKPVVELANEALDSPLVSKLLSDEQEVAIRHEIAAYQDNSRDYIADLTGQKLRDVPLGSGNPALEKVASIKNKIRVYYDNTLNGLVVDLRIFSISNLVAATIAFGLAYRSSTGVRKPIVWFSFLMFVAVLYCSYMYVDDLTFFRILFRTHMGWWYGALLGIVIVALFLDYGYHANAATQSESHGDADSEALRG